MKDITFKVEDIDIYKKSALALYNLDENDQSWILDNLSESQSKKLKLLMNELSEIGIEKNDSVISDILKDNSSLTSDDEAPSEYIEITKKLDELTPTEIFSILSDEPPAMVAMVLSVKNWPWSTKYISMLPINISSDIREHMKMYVSTLSSPIKRAIVSYLEQSAFGKIDEVIS